MDLTTHYETLLNESIQKIKTNEYHTDSLIDSPFDDRFGITLLIRPDDKSNAQILHFLSVLKKVAPRQYFYPSSDIHITIIPIISCYSGFQLSQISINMELARPQRDFIL